MTDDELERLANAVIRLDGGMYGHPAATKLGHGVLALLGRVRNAEARAKALEKFAEGFAQTVDAAVRHAENDGTGMQVPFHGDFAAAKRLPSVLQSLKRWHSAAREALDTTP